MAITGDDISSLMKNVDLKSLLSGGGAMSDSSNVMGGGVLGAVLIGALLPRLLGDQNGTAATLAASATPHLTAADVTTQVGALLSMQDINEVKRDIYQSQGNVQQSILQAEINAGLQNGITTKSVTDNAAWLQTTQLQGQIAQLQSSAAGIATTNAGVNEVNNSVRNSIDATLSSANTLNTNLLTGLNNVERIVTADGVATRALITDLNTANLNRAIVVADNRIAELLGDRNNLASGVNVTTTVNQAQAQSQAQQQQIATNNLLTQLVGVIQHNTQSTVNLGTMIGSGQTATNVKS